MTKQKILALMLAAAMAFSLCGCTGETASGSVADSASEPVVSADADVTAAENTEESVAPEARVITEEQLYIEETLNLANNAEQTWTYDAGGDAWVLSVVSAVAYPELPDQQGVSVCVPGAYVTGIDTDGDGVADTTSETATESVKGSLIIDYEAQIVSTNGQVYTAATAPVILNTGAAGYGSQNNATASTTHAANGYINVSCGNRGKQDTATDESGNTYYTGDAPSCLVDQKAAARYVKYNILLGNLPGNVDCFVSTGGSGGGAHAAMFAATSNNSDYYDYQIEAGAVGLYKNEDGSYSTTVTIDGVDYEISDGAWGCIAYSAITSLYEADMALAFEYYLNTDYDFKTDFQAQLAEYLSESYMEYINGQNLSVAESAVGFDLDNDGELSSVISLTIEYDLEAHPETNGYYGTYLDLYLAEFTENLQWYLDNLDYAEGWTWFDESGNTLSNDEVAAMTGEDKAQAFIEGRYTKNSGGVGGMIGGMGGAMGEMPVGEMPEGIEGMMNGAMPEGMGGMMNGAMPAGQGGSIGNGFDVLVGADTGTTQEFPMGELPAMDVGEVPEGMTGDPRGTMSEMPGGEMIGGEMPSGEMGSGEMPSGEMPGGEMAVGTPDAGTTQSASGSGMDSANYTTYDEMVEAYRADIEEIYAGDEYGNNIVELYDPLNYIGSGDTENPTWTKIIMGASEGDISLFNSLNLQIAWLSAGVDAEIEWQWDGGHVPSEVLGDSFSLYVDQMYGEYMGGIAVEKPEATGQTENGTSESATGINISDWITYSDTTAISFSLADAAAYRTAGASKAMPGFDVIDYGQEDYVFGDETQDARHWNTFLLEIFQQHADTLSTLFNSNE